MAPRVRKLPYIPQVSEPVLVPPTPPASSETFALAVQPQRLRPPQPYSVASVGVSQMSDLYEQAARRATSVVEIADAIRSAFFPGSTHHTVHDPQYLAQVQAYLEEMLEITDQAGEQIISIATGKAQ